jgi:hypothetical protein
VLDRLRFAEILNHIAIVADDSNRMGRSMRFLRGAPRCGAPEFDS